MFTRLLTVLLCALCLPRPSAAQELITVPLTDKTAPSSPLQVRGRFPLQEAIHGNELEWSWGEKVVLKNVSDKPVLFFVVTLSELGRYTRGQRAAPGD